MESIPQRICNKCGIEFPRTDEHWHKNKACKEGLAYYCKACARAHINAHRRVNPKPISDERREYLRQYMHEYKKKYKRNCSKKQSDVDKAREAEQRKRNYEKNKDKILAQQKEYRQRNSEKVRMMLRESRHRRRARELEVEGSHTKEDILLQYRSQHGKCWWCAKKVGSKYHVDHVRPITRGGSDNPNNLVVSCPFCNRSKKDKLPQEWDGRMF